MFVECLGLPASGKSTLIRGCSQALQKQGFRILSAPLLDALDVENTDMPGYVRRGVVSRTMYRAESFELSYPNCTRLIRDVFGTEKTARALIMGVAVRHQIAAAHQTAFDLAFVDEGFVHRFIHILIKQHQGDVGLLTQFCDSMPVPDGVIYLDIPAALSQSRALERLTVRNGGRHSAQQLEKRIKAAHGDLDTLKRRQALMEQAVAQLGARGCKIIRVPTSHDVEGALAYAVTELGQLMPTAKPTAPRYRKQPAATNINES